MAIQDLLGTSFPFRKGDRGYPQPVAGAETIVDDLAALLTIERGEIPMEPNLGTRMQGFVFQTSGPLLQARVAQEIRSIVQNYEQRAQVLSVRTAERAEQGGIALEAVVDLRIGGETARLAIPLKGS